MEPYHDRMPVLLAEQDFDAWLDGTLGPEALKLAAEAALREWPADLRFAGVFPKSPVRSGVPHRICIVGCLPTTHYRLTCPRGVLLAKSFDVPGEARPEQPVAGEHHLQSRR
jgi:hypothetical protein